MSNFARFWKSFNKGEARKGAELPYDALVKVDGINYHVGNYDSIHDEYSLVTRQDGKTVIKKFPASQVEGVQKDSKDKEFIEQNQGEDDNEENIEALDNANKSINPEIARLESQIRNLDKEWELLDEDLHSSRDNGERRAIERDMKEIVDEIDSIQTKIDRIDTNKSNTSAKDDAATSQVHKASVEDMTTEDLRKLLKQTKDVILKIKIEEELKQRRQRAEEDNSMFYGKSQVQKDAINDNQNKKLDEIRTEIKQLMDKGTGNANEYEKISRKIKKLKNEEAKIIRESKKSQVQKSIYDITYEVTYSNGQKEKMTSGFETSGNPEYEFKPAKEHELQRISPGSRIKVLDIREKTKKSQVQKDNKDSQKFVSHLTYKGHDVDKFLNEENGYTWYVVDDMQMSGEFDTLNEAQRAIDKGEFDKSQVEKYTDQEIELAKKKYHEAAIQMREAYNKGDNKSFIDAQKKLTDAAKIFRPSKSITEKIIRHEGDKWILYSHKGKVLGTHPSKEQAEAQEAAVEANKSAGYDGDVGLDEPVKLQYKVGDKIMRKGRKYVITDIRSDGKYVLKPAADSRGRDGSWVEEKEIHGYARKSVLSKSTRDDIANFLLHTKEKNKQRLFDEVNRRFYDGKHIHDAIDEVMDYIENAVPPEDRHLYKDSGNKEKDIMPYGQSFNSGTILGAHKGDDTSEYEVKPTHATNVNNMDPTVLENEDDYTIEPTYAMVNDEATKRTKKSISEQLAEVEKAIYSLKTFEKTERDELYAKRAELLLNREICAKNAGIAKSVAVKTALELNNSSIPTLKEVLKGLTKGNAYQIDDAASEVCERFDVGGFGWIQRATLWLSGKGFASSDIKTILMKAEENMERFEDGDTSSY